MRLSKALRKARKKLCTVKNEALGYFNQKPGNLGYWLLEQELSDTERKHLLGLFLDSRDWELDDDSK